MRIAVIHGNDGSDVRVGKTCRSLNKLGHEVYFIGWDRNPDGVKTINLGNTSLQTIKLYAKHNRWNPSGQIYFLWHIVKALKRIRPETVCCVNEDLTFLVLPFRGIFYKHMVCDIYDSLYDRHSHRMWPLRILLWIIVNIVRTLSDRLIVTDERRFGRIKEKHQHKCIIVENVPEDPGEYLSKQIPEGKTKIYVTGSLGRDKGLESLIEAVEPMDDVEIISAGWPGYDYAKDVFIKHKKVTFKGVVTLQQSLELAAQCDVFLALYAPFCTNNVYASPNKICDAMSVGRPVIINPEPFIAEWVKQNKLGFLCDYGDVKQLREIIGQLKENRSRLPEFASHARKLYIENHTWEKMEERLKSLYTALNTI